MIYLMWAQFIVDINVSVLAVVRVTYNSYKSLMISRILKVDKLSDSSVNRTLPADVGIMVMNQGT